MTQHPPTSDNDCPKAIALIGNPNCGKTTLFNGLTGSRYKVANYPGVTVERKEGSLPLADGSCARIIDLPGTYAIVGSSLDERIVTQLLRGEISGTPKPDLIVAVVDATNLERNLFLISELLDTEYPILLAVNMMDAADQSGIKVYGELLSRALDVPVVPISARNKFGLSTLVSEITKALANPRVSSKKHAWIPTEHSLRSQLELLSPLTTPSSDPAIITTVGSLRYAWIRGVVRKTTSQSSNDDVAVVSAP